MSSSAALLLLVCLWWSCGAGDGAGDMGDVGAEGKGEDDDNGGA